MQNLNFLFAKGSNKMSNILRLVIFLASLQTIVSSTAYAGNDTVFFRAETSVYQESPVSVEYITAVPSYLSSYSGEEFQPVEIFIGGSIDGNPDFRSNTGIVGFQLEGSGFYSSVLTATYGGELYLFTNLRNLQLGEAEAVVGSVSADGLVSLYSAYKQETSLVEYNPTVLDKIMSWVISLGGRVTEADEWLEFKIIEKK